MNTGLEVQCRPSSIITILDASTFTEKELEQI